MKTPYNKERGNKKMVCVKLDPDIIDMLCEIGKAEHRSKGGTIEYLVTKEYQQLFKTK